MLASTHGGLATTLNLSRAFSNICPGRSPVPLSAHLSMARSILLLAAALAPAAAFVPAGSSPRAALSALSAVEMSKSIPYLMKPKNLDSMPIGNREFDPLGLAEMYDIKFMREAEIKHGRTSMLACLGFVSPEIFPWCKGIFPGEAYTHTNPLNAASAVPVRSKSPWHYHDHLDGCVPADRASR
jgi:hypothetical protein